MSQIALIFNDERGPELAQRLLNRGFRPICCDLRFGAASSQPPLAPAVRQVATPALAVADCSTVLTLLDSQQQDEDVYMGDNGILTEAETDSLLIDLSTITPRLAREMHALAAVHDLAYIEAPILGGLEDLACGQARLLVAGEADNCRRAQPILTALNQQILVMGLPGCGMTAKIAWQIALAAGLIGLVEALALAGPNNLEKSTLLTLLASPASPVQSMAAAYGPRVLAEDFRPTQNVKSFLTDLEIALEAAEEIDLPLPGLETAQQLYDLLQLIGDDHLGVQSLALAYYDEKNSQRFGLNWDLAQKAMDVYERSSGSEQDDLTDYDDEDDEDDEDETEYHTSHQDRQHSEYDEATHHHHWNDPGPQPSLGSFFSHN